MTFAKRPIKLVLGGMALWLLISALLVAFVAFSSHQAMAASDASPSLTKTVDITTNSQGVFTFKPQTLTIKVGTTVIWKNLTTVGHTVTSNTGVFGSGVINPGGTFKFTFNKKGAFHYHCQIHPFMTGTITVQ